MRGFMAAIFAMGVLRFVLTVSGVPNSTVKWFSMTALLPVGALYFAATTKTHLERLYASYFLILPYMIVEVVGLTYTWVSGATTIFQAPEYTMGFGIVAHTFGHLLGGLTWEPAVLFVIMEIFWAIIALGRRSFSGR